MMMGLQLVFFSLQVMRIFEELNLLKTFQEEKSVLL